VASRSRASGWAVTSVAQRRRWVNRLAWLGACFGLAACSTSAPPSASSMAFPTTTIHGSRLLATKSMGYKECTSCVADLSVYEDGFALWQWSGEPGLRYEAQLLLDAVEVRTLAQRLRSEPGRPPSTTDERDVGCEVPLDRPITFSVFDTGKSTNYDTGNCWPPNPIPPGDGFSQLEKLWDRLQRSARRVAPIGSRPPTETLVEATYRDRHCSGCLETLTIRSDGTAFWSSVDDAGTTTDKRSAELKLGRAWADQLDADLRAANFDVSAYEPRTCLEDDATESDRSIALWGEAPNRIDLYPCNQTIPPFPVLIRIEALRTHLRATSR
jgi:hypothetical protein